jgi:hypothetical protein
MIRRCLVAAVLFLAAGCAQMRATMGENEQARQLAGLITYAQNVAAMRPDSQRHELDDAKQTYAQDPAPYATVRLALLLSLPGTEYADEAGAAALLEPLAGPRRESAGTDTLRQFAQWLHGQIAERAREQSNSAQLKEQLDAERARQRRKSAQLKEQLDAELTREHRKSAQLKEQLDALRAIERNLIDRSQGAAR